MPKQRGNFWNLAEYLRRLGIQSAGEQPELLDTVQPVLIAGDASALTTPFIPALAWAGRLQNGTALRFTGLTIHSRAPGGTLIRSLRVELSGTSGGGNWIWEVVDGVHAFTASAGEVQLFQMGPVDCTAFVATGNNDVSLLNSSHPVIQNNSDLAFFVDEFFIPPGKNLFIHHDVVQSAIVVAALLQDVPVQIPGGD